MIKPNNMKKLLFLIPLIFLLFISSTYSQSVELTDIQKREFRGVFPILNKNTNSVKGYYSFYVNEKAEAGRRNFVIVIFDEKLDLLNKTSISISKRSVVDGAEFDGENFLFIFNDLIKKRRTLITCDSDGNIIKEKHVQESKGSNYNASVYTSSNGGFYIVMPIREKKTGYSVEKVDKDLNTLWERRFMPNKGFIGVATIESGEGMIIMIQQTKPSLMSKKIGANLVALDDETGEEEFVYPLYDGNITRQPSAFAIGSNHEIITAGMYFDGEKWDGKNSDGIFFLKLSADGEEIISTTENWDEGIQQIIKDGSKKTFTISSKPKVLFHDIIVNEAGNYQVIGETFKKSFQLVSIISKDIITGRYIGNINSENAKPITFEIMDFIIFNFDNDGEMSGINMITKEHTKISCYPPYSRYGGLSLAIKVRDYGWFNYKFMQSATGSEDSKMVSCLFVQDPYIGIYSFEDGEYSDLERIPITKKSIRGGGMGVMPGSPGNLGVYIYSKKEKSLLIYLQDFD
ncbi:MAG: hypothetical protein COA49_10230 [Bacteroidetes bacterium]|nr:MAG: hypothetical protein COA49_10230 [Bacteroidota bacterium]